MKILVAYKHVVDYDVRVKIKPDGSGMVTERLKDVGTTVAINKNAEAPIFDIADIGLAGDFSKLLPEPEAAF